MRPAPSSNPEERSSNSRASRYSRGWGKAAVDIPAMAVVAAVPESEVAHRSHPRSRRLPHFPGPDKPAAAQEQEQAQAVDTVAAVPGLPAADFAAAVPAA